MAEPRKPSRNAPSVRTASAAGKPTGKKTPAARKTVSAVNLAALGADRLAGLLMEAAAGNANLKRRLRLELVSEVGAPDLALEIDKRLDALAASRTRVSWRKRPELIEDLQTHRRAIVEQLAAMDAPLALNRLVAWFDLYPGLAARVKDPKGELSDLFFDAAPDLAAVGARVEASVAAEGLSEPLETRLSEWGGWIGRASPLLSVTLAIALLSRLTEGRPRPTGRRALVVRKLADRAGDVTAWAEAIPDEDKTRPEIGAEIARRLAAAGRSGDARTALEASRPRAAAPSRSLLRTGAPPVAEASDAWEAAEIAVLEAEGRAGDAQAARWAAFERTLDETQLKGFVSRLADFEDVEALDRAHVLAAAWPDATRGLAFLMTWPALREAAGLILARSDELRVTTDDTALWSARLQARYPNAALALIRARARMLARQGLGRSEEVLALSAEAQGLAEAPGALDGVPTHAAFIDDLESLSPTPMRRLWR